MLSSIMLREAWCAINLRPVFTCLTLATAPLLDTAFSLNPLRISRNRTITEVSLLHFLTFINRPTRLTLFPPASSRKCIEFIASCQRFSCLPSATVLPYLISRLFLGSIRAEMTRKSIYKLHISKINGNVFKSVATWIIKKNIVMQQSMLLWREIKITLYFCFTNITISFAIIRGWLKSCCCK